MKFTSSVIAASALFAVVASASAGKKKAVKHRGKHHVAHHASAKADAQQENVCAVAYGKGQSKEATSAKKTADCKLNVESSESSAYVSDTYYQCGSHQYPFQSLWFTPNDRCEGGFFCSPGFDECHERCPKYKNYNVTSIDMGSGYTNCIISCAHGSKCPKKMKCYKNCEICTPSVFVVLSLMHHQLTRPRNLTCHLPSYLLLHTLLILEPCLFVSLFGLFRQDCEVLPPPFARLRCGGRLCLRSLNLNHCR